MNFWEKVKNDLQKGIKEGIDFVKEGATIVKVKAEELTEEGKKDLRFLNSRQRFKERLQNLAAWSMTSAQRSRTPCSKVRLKQLYPGSKNLRHR